MEGDWSHPIHRPPLKQTDSLPELNDSRTEQDESSRTEQDESSRTDEPDESSKPDEPQESSRTEQPGPNSITNGVQVETKAKDDTEKTDDGTERGRVELGHETETSKVEGEERSKKGAGDKETKADKEEEDDDLDETNDTSDDWRPKPISESLPEGHFLFIPPHR